MKRSNDGFSFAEIMVVTAIVGILAAIALPAYGRYVYRSQRVEAKTVLQEIAQRQERFNSTYNIYSGSLTGNGTAGLGRVANCGAGVGSETCLYVVTVATQNAGLQYTLTAAPQGRQAGDVCGSLTLTGAGVKAFTGAETNGACW